MQPKSLKTARISRRALALGSAALCALGTAGALIPQRPAAAASATIRVEFLPAASRYPRTTPITLRARLVSGSTALANRRVTWGETSTKGSFGLGDGWTDRNGYVTLRYTVPGDVNKDNVYIKAKFAGEPGISACEDSRRIPIGL